MQQQCSGQTKAGERCRGKALPTSRYCIAHDPDKVVEMAEYRRQGGQARSNKARAQKELPAEPLSNAEAHAYLSLAFRRAMVGKLDAPMLNALSSAAKALQDLSRTVEQDVVIAELSAELAALKRRPA
jgi:hypothetical protein